MAYLFGLIIVTLFFVVLHYFTELAKSQKLSITAIVLVIILSAIAYNGYNASQSQKLLEVVKKFQQNRTLLCDSKEVNATNYDLSTGTYTFIGRKNSPYEGEMISATRCE